jgi:hypothetical protein
MRVQVATHQAPAAVAESCKTESHAVAASEIDHRARTQIFRGQQSKDAIQPQLPSDKPAVGARASGKQPVHKADAVPQPRIGGRLKLDHQSGDRRPNTADEYAQRYAADHPGQKLLLQVRAGQRGRVQWGKRAAAQKTSEVHRRHDNQRLEQRIVDESTGHG